MVLRHVVVVSVLFMVLASPVAGEEFVAVLFDDQYDEHFIMSGIVDGDRSGDGSRFHMEYDLRFMYEKGYDNTTINTFQIHLTDGNGTVYTTESVDGYDLEFEESRHEILRFSSGAAITDIREIVVNINHTVRKPGSTWKASVEGSFPYETNQDVYNIKTNASQVVRGGNVYVTVQTKNVQELFVNQSGNLTALNPGERGVYAMWIPVPIDTQLGDVTQQYPFITGKNHTETLELTLPVQNVPPTMNLTYSTEVRAGEDLPVQARTTDDTGIEQVTLRFNGSTERNDSGSFTLPTGDLPTGNYSFTVTAVDQDGVAVQENGSFRIVEKLSAPPTFTVKAADQIIVGADLPVTVNPTGSTRMQDATLSFQKNGYVSSDGTFTVPTSELQPGTYTFTVTVTSAAGITATKEQQFQVVKETTGQDATATGQDGNGGGNGGSGVSENASVLISVVNTIRDFIKNTLLGG